MNEMYKVYFLFVSYYTIVELLLGVVTGNFFDFWPTVVTPTMVGFHFWSSTVVTPTMVEFVFVVTGKWLPW